MSDMAERAFVVWVAGLRRYMWMPPGKAVFMDGGDHTGSAVARQWDLALQETARVGTAPPLRTSLQLTCTEGAHRCRSPAVTGLPAVHVQLLRQQLPRVCRALPQQHALPRLRALEHGEAGRNDVL